MVGQDEVEALSDPRPGNSHPRLGNPGAEMTDCKQGPVLPLTIFLFTTASRDPIEPKSLVLQFNLVPSAPQMESSCFASAGVLI